MNSGQQKKFLTLSLAVVVAFCCSEKTVSAQGDFGGFQVQRNQPAPATFQPPAGSQSFAKPVSQPVLTRPQATWPEQPVQYDDLVKQANLEQTSGSNGLNGLIGSTMDSAGQFLGSWKEKIGQQTDQLLGSSDSESSASGWFSTIKQKANSPDTRRMLGSLALVVGGYLALVVVLRKFGGGGQRGIPAEVVSVLGNLPYGHKQNLRLVRLGSKLVLLLNGPEGTHPIGEITNPDEVDYLASLCQGKRAVRPQRLCPCLVRQNRATHEALPKKVSPRFFAGLNRPLAVERPTMRLKQNQMQATGRTRSGRWISCEWVALAIGLLIASNGAAQMLQPDRSGWGDSRSVETPANDWPYSQPSQSVPVDRIPNEEIRNEIGLANFEQESKVKAEPRLAEADQVYNARFTVASS